MSVASLCAEPLEKGQAPHLVRGDWCGTLMDRTGILMGLLDPCSIVYRSSRRKLYSYSADSLRADIPGDTKCTTRVVKLFGRARQSSLRISQAHRITYGVVSRSTATNWHQLFFAEQACSAERPGRSLIPRYHGSV